jgi:DNA (cytosine-5)-methyltransferase 1
MDLKFIDLFCGIGGFHQAILRSIPNAKCVLSSDFDKNVQKTYELNYGITPLGDIKNINIETIPEFSLLCAGFPCQAFSSAGKKNAFNDPRGTLFFDMMNMPEYLVYFKLLINRKKLREQEKVFKQICQYLNWPFKSSIS